MAVAFGGPVCQSCLDEEYTGKECGECKDGASLNGLLGAMCGVMLIFFCIFAFLFMRLKEESTKKKKKGCCGNRKEIILSRAIQTEKGLVAEVEFQAELAEHKLEEKLHKERKEKDKDYKKKKPELVRKKTKKEKLEGARGSTAARRFVGDQMLMGRVDNSPSGNGAFRNDSQIIMDRVKIFYGWLQIFTALTFTFEIAWPIEFKTFSLSMGFINFDMSNLLSESACQFSVPFLDKMTVHLAVPFMLLFTLLLSSIPAHFLRKQHRVKQAGLRVKLIASLALILYPGLCTLLFSSLKTVHVQGIGNVLAVDYSVEAFGAKHMPYVFLTIAGVVLYVIGVPFAVVLALRSNKKYLYEAGETEEDKFKHERVVNAFGTLYLQCEFFF